MNSSMLHSLQLHLVDSSADALLHEADVHIVLLSLMTCTPLSGQQFGRSGRAKLNLALVHVLGVSLKVFISPA